MEDTLLWYGWKDISIDNRFIGGTVTKGKGSWQKDYTYINIPSGYGYDGYCFLLSSRCVGETYFSVCHDMRIELFKNPKEREPDKKYPRYKMNGHDLFEQIFKGYEIDFEAEYIERLKKEQQEKERKDKAIKGKCICGIYTGNIYGNSDNGYMHDTHLRAYFAAESGCTYFNKKFQKVHNVRVITVVCDSMTRYEFNKWEDIINAYLKEYNLYYEYSEALKNHIELAQNKSKVEMKYRPECLVKTDINDLHDAVLGEIDTIMKIIIERLQKRIDMLRKDSEQR